MRYGVTVLRRASAIAIGALGAAAPAAQQAINTIQRAITPEVARCIIRREATTVEQWLATAPETGAEIRLFRSSEPRFHACFGHIHNPFTAGGWLIEYNRSSIRSALIRAKLQDRHAAMPQAAPATTAPDSWYRSPTDTAGDASATTASFVAATSACLALKHWQEVRTLIIAVKPVDERAHFGSRWAKLMEKREADVVRPALDRVIPSLPGCVPQGVTLHLDRVRLRAMLEEAAYHLTQKP